MRLGTVRCLGFPGMGCPAGFSVISFLLGHILLIIIPYVIIISESEYIRKFLVTHKYAVELLLCFAIWHDHRVTSLEPQKAFYFATQAR